MKTVILCALLALAGPAAAVDISTYSFAGCAFSDTGQTVHYSVATGDDSDYQPGGGSMSFTIYNGSAWGGTATSSVTVDNRTGLMWVTNPNDACASCPGAYVSSGTYLWSMALKQCENAVYAGFSDWRLPNIKELLSIVKHHQATPLIDTAAFFNTAATTYSIYWSSTTYVPTPNGAWTVFFNYGYPSYGANKGAGYGYYVRCVRGGP